MIHGNWNKVFTMCYDSPKSSNTSSKKQHLHIKLNIIMTFSFHHIYTSISVCGFSPLPISHHHTQGILTEIISDIRSTAISWAFTIKTPHPNMFPGLIIIHHYIISECYYIMTDCEILVSKYLEWMVWIMSECSWFCCIGSSWRFALTDAYMPPHIGEY